MTKASPPQRNAASLPIDGLWAYYKGDLLVLQLNPQNKKIDHASWFQEMGLPDVGIGFDRILRGRMTWDWDQKHYVLAFYDSMILPNHVYQKVIYAFNSSGRLVIEKPVATDWANAF